MFFSVVSAPNVAHKRSTNKSHKGIKRLSQGTQNQEQLLYCLSTHCDHQTAGPSAMQAGGLPKGVF